MQSNVQIIVKEIKIRITWFLVSFVVTCICAYIFSEELLFILAKPLLSAQLRSSILLTAFLSTQIAETFNTYIITSIIFSAFVCVPVLAYQTWCFFIPSCYIYQRIQLTQTYFTGILFCFVILYLCTIFLLPNVWRFLYEINHTSGSVFLIQLQPKIYDFIILTIHILFFVFICSKMLVIIIALIKYNKLVLNFHEIRKYRKLWILFIILITALITPPDFLCQISMLLPILIAIESIVFYSMLQKLYMIQIENQT